MYEVDSLEVGEQLSVLEADIVDWHWDESVHGILYARFATSDRMEETRCSSSYVAAGLGKAVGACQNKLKIASQKARARL